MHNKPKFRQVTATHKYSNKEIFKICLADEIGNTDNLFCTGNHPFYVQGQGFIRADKLKSDNNLISQNQESIKITSIEKQKHKQNVYDLTINDTHTFFVSELGVWVHNSEMKELTLDEIDGYVKSKALSGNPENFQEEVKNIVSGAVVNDSYEISVKEAVTLKYKNSSKSVDDLELISSAFTNGVLCPDFEIDIRARPFIDNLMKQEGLTQKEAFRAVSKKTAAELSFTRSFMDVIGGFQSTNLLTKAFEVPEGGTLNSNLLTTTVRQSIRIF